LIIKDNFLNIKIIMILKKLMPFKVGKKEAAVYCLTILVFLGVSILWILAETSWARQTTLESHHLERLVDILQKRYDQTGSIAAHFNQKTFAVGDTEGVSAQGQVYFKRPHLMRWEYEKPAKQLIVTSGDQVYIYEVEAKQVTVIPRRQFLSSEISRAFFFGKGDLRHDFNIAPPPPELDNPDWSLCLIPKKRIPQLKKLLITLDPHSHLVSRIIIEDQMGGRTIIGFSDIRLNPRLSPSLFRFSIPKGVEVYRGQ